MRLKKIRENKFIYQFDRQIDMFICKEEKKNNEIIARKDSTKKNCNMSHQ